MAGITAAMVKDLRDKTGAGMMDCKQALNETSGDVEAAIDWLRTKGLSKAAKKAGRLAADGLIGVRVSDDAKSAAVVEVNAETDFVARNDQFQDLVSTAAALALDAKGDLEALLQAKLPGKDIALGDHVSNLIATIGENMSIRRCRYLAVPQGAVAAYVHNQAAPGMGKIGVLVALESGGDAEALAALGKQLAMHVAAANPVALDKDSVDPAMIERERGILMEQARESGKPEDIIAKMVEGRLRKYFEEVALLSQTFVIDNETKIEKVVADKAKEIGAPIKVAGFARYELGEGIEKEKEDFAAEVAAVASN